MITCKCIEKFRDKQGAIYGYRLQDYNGQTQDVKAQELKQAIINKQIQVTNLTLTSDNRLVDTSENKQDTGIKTVYIVTSGLSIYNHLDIDLDGLCLDELNIMTVKDTKDAISKCKMLGTKYFELDDNTLLINNGNTYRVAKVGINVKYIGLESDNIINALQNGLEVDFLCHPRNDMSNRKKIRDGEIAYRLYNTTYLYVINYLNGPDGDFYGNIDYSLFNKIASYKWRIMKSFIPIYDYLHNKYNITEAQFSKLLTSKYNSDDNEVKLLDRIGIKCHNNKESVPQIKSIAQYYKEMNIPNIEAYDEAEASLNVCAYVCDGHDIYIYDMILDYERIEGEFLSTLGIEGCSNFTVMPEWLYFEWITYDANPDINDNDDFYYTLETDGGHK